MIKEFFFVVLFLAHCDFILKDLYMRVSEVCITRN